MKISFNNLNFNIIKTSQKVKTNFPAFCGNNQDNFEMSIGYVNDIHGQTNNMIRILSGFKGDLRLSAGDINTGNEKSKPSNMAGIQFLNIAKMHATAIGNHEMDTTQADLYDSLQHYNGQVLISNMHIHLFLNSHFLVLLLFLAHKILLDILFSLTTHTIPYFLLFFV